MFKTSLLFLAFLACVNCQNWVSRACLANHTDYYTGIMQEVVRRLETEVKWCNFKLPDINQVIDLRLFNLHALGTVDYTNGFLVNFKKVDVTTITSQFSSRTQNGTTLVFSTLNGVLNFRDMIVGYDVHANLGELGEHHFTAIMPYTTHAVRIVISRDINTKEVTVSSSIASTLPNGRRLLYQPDNAISDIISRNFSNTLPGSGIGLWRTTYIEPIVLDVASKTELPEIRFDYRC